MFGCIFALLNILINIFLSVLSVAAYRCPKTHCGMVATCSLRLPVSECPSFCRSAIYSRLPTEKAMSLPLLWVLTWLLSYGGSAG